MSQNTVLLNNAREEVKKRYDVWFAEYQDIAKKSRDEEINKLQAGRPIPEDGRIYGEYWKDEFTQVTDKMRAEALNILTKEYHRLSDVITEAPNDEAVRTIDMFSLRAVSEPIENRDAKERYAAEIDMLMNKYGENYGVYQTLRAYAEKAGIYDFKQNNTAKEVVVCETLEEIVNREFAVSKAILNGMSDYDKTRFYLAIDHAGEDAFEAIKDEGENAEDSQE